MELAKVNEFHMMLRVLVIEDSPVSRAMLREMLEDQGHRVIAEADGAREALEAYRNHRPDLVTLDLSLTRDDGLSVLKALREFDPGAHILVVSGNPQKKIISQALTAGASGFLIKPIQPAGLEEAISRLPSPGPAKE